jgi:inositol phosphorylceramide synthase regulatory subunit
MVVEGLEGMRRESQVHGKVVPQETATSMVLIAGLTLIRVYFTFVAMAYARTVLQKYIQIMILEGPGVDEQTGPFAAELPDGEGRRGQLGRLMVTYGREYWLEQPETVGWVDGMPSHKHNAAGTLAGHV